MSKQLPFFRFYVSEWMNDDISAESYRTKGIFADVCAFYWFKDCTIDLKTLLKKYSNAKKTILELVSSGIIKHNSSTGFIEIKFLDEQFDLLSEARKKKQDAGRLGGLASSKQSSSDA